MILNGIEEIQKLLPSVNLRLDSTRLDDFMSRAQQWVTDEIIGSGLEELLETDIADGATDDHVMLRHLVQRVIAQYGYILFGDEMNLQLSEAGMVVQQNQAMQAASTARRDNLIRSLWERLEMDCDMLVNLLMNTSTEGAAYESWRNTEQFAYLTVAFLPTMRALRKHLPPKSSWSQHWPDFNNGLLNMSVEMMDIAAPYVSSAEIIELRDLYRGDSMTSAQEQAVESLRDVAVCNLVGDSKRAIRAAIRARDIMLGSIDDFPRFAESDCKTLPGVDFNAGHLVNTL